MPQAEYRSLPFDEAIKFFQDKVNLPTGKWTDLREGMHSRAFVVAGAVKDSLLSDLYDAVDRGNSEGTTLADFRKDFDRAVEKAGWSYKGGRGWRTGVIFNTNLRTAYAAGHYKQMTDAAVLRARPFWRYVAVMDSRTRPEHAKWHGTVLPADDPWWKTHYPPNGWGCRCQVVSLSDSEMERDGLAVSERPDDGTYEWMNPATGEVMEVPNGIDPGWAYNPGETAWGQELSKKTMDEWDAQGAKAWERLTPGDYAAYGRQETVPLDAPAASLGGKVPAYEIEAEIRKIIGADEKVYSFQSGEFRYDILVNAKTLAEHIDPARDQYLPFLPETLSYPYEVWLSFERHRGTGKVVIRQRLIKAIKTGKKEGMLAVTNAVNGLMEALTFIPVEQMSYLNKQRAGKLIWKRE